MQMTKDERTLLKFMLDSLYVSGWGIPTELEEAGWDVGRYDAALDSLREALLS